MADYGDAILKGLLDYAKNSINYSPLAIGSRALGAAAGTEVGQNPASNMAQAVAMPGPYAEGVSKGLKKAGESHAVEALQMGVPATHIEQQAGLNQQNSVSQPPQQVAPNGQAPMNQQNPLQVIGQLLGQVRNLTTTPEHRLQNTQAQLVGQQAQNATPQGALAMKTAEAQTPLNTYEKASLAAGGFQAQATALNNQLERMNQDQTALESLIKTYESVRGPMNKAVGGPSKEMKQLQNQWSSLQQAKAKVHTKLANLYGQQPNFTPGGKESSGSLPSRESAPKGATGWDSEKGAWVY